MSRTEPHVAAAVDNRGCGVARRTQRFPRPFSRGSQIESVLIADGIAVSSGGIDAPRRTDRATRDRGLLRGRARRTVDRLRCTMERSKQELRSSNRSEADQPASIHFLRSQRAIFVPRIRVISSARKENGAPSVVGVTGVPIRARARRPHGSSEVRMSAECVHTRSRRSRPQLVIVHFENRRPEPWQQVCAMGCSCR